MKRISSVTHFPLVLAWFAGNPAFAQLLDHSSNRAIHVFDFKRMPQGRE